MNKFIKHNKSIKDIIPSEFSSDFWIYCANKDYYKSDKKKLGKWCVFGKASVLDKVWKKLIPVVEDNNIINCAKIRTGAVSISEVLSGQVNKTSVICIYTYDYRNSEDVFKVRDLIRSIGVKSIIKYKTEQATYDNKYGEDEFLYIDKKKIK